LSDSVRQITPSRFSWLFVNLLTAILASSVIKLFDATIEHMVALAVLMPIVASMGGNAGTQTMTVAVRALATGELGAANVVRVVLRETMVGPLNGLAFAALMGIVVLLWYGTGKPGAVIAGAMVINLLAAALAGIFRTARSRSSGSIRRCIDGVRDDGDRCGRLFRFSRPGDRLADVDRKVMR
jgi:magnesium transporter